MAMGFESDRPPFLEAEGGIEAEICYKHAPFLSCPNSVWERRVFFEAPLRADKVIPSWKANPIVISRTLQIIVQSSLLALKAIVPPS